MHHKTPEALECLLNSNLPPTLEEQDTAQRELHLFDVQLQEVNAQITALEAQLAALKNERSAILSNRAPYADILSARRRLPQEVISKIMELVCDLEFPENDSPTHYPSTNDSPINDLMLVSKSWYNAACSTATFWNRTHLSFPLSMDEQGLEDDLAKAAIRVRRASQLPLSFSLVVGVNGSVQQKIANFIKPLAQRLSHFSITIPFDSKDAHDLQILDELFLMREPTSGEYVNWDALQSLKLDILSKSPSECLDAIFCTTANRFPQLQHLSLNSAVQKLTSPSPTFENLTSLAISGMSSYDILGCLSILRQCSKLQHCRLRPTGRVRQHQVEEDDSTISNVLLPYLTNLEISSQKVYEVITCTILKHLETPSLCSFVYTTFEAFDMWTSSIYGSLEDLIRRSQCQERFRVLELRTRHGFNHTHLVDKLDGLFASTPNLEVFKLVGRKMDPGITFRIPKSVKQLEITMECPWIGMSQEWFASTVRALVEGEDGELETDPGNDLHLNASFVIQTDDNRMMAARRDLAEVIAATPGLVVHMD